MKPDGLLAQLFQTPLEPWDTWRGFLTHALRIGLFSLFLSLSAVVALASTGLLDLELLKRILLLTAPLALLVYLVLFATRRAWIPVLLSRRLNIVVAYNLEVAGYDYLEDYRRFIKSLEAHIREHNLGQKVRVITRPPDVVFDDSTAAEAKTKLGLLGSTLLIWGHITRHRGRVKLTTRFSYEFGYPGGMNERQAKEIFGRDIQRALNKGLFGLDRFMLDLDADTFGERALAVSLFILGLAAASLGQIEKAVELLGEFLHTYRTSDALRQREMGPAAGEAERHLRRFKLGLAYDSYERKDYEQTRRYLEGVLDLDKHDTTDYLAYIGLARYYETIGNRPEARRMNAIAAERAPLGYYHHEFSEAYFALTEGHYDTAITTYEAIPIPNNVVVTDVRQFLGDKYKDTKDPTFLFADGLVAWRFQSPAEGQTFLNEFLKSVQGTDNRKYQILMTKAQELSGNQDEQARAV